jgi:hypothetical protein
VFATNCDSRKPFGYRSGISAAAATTCLIACIMPALADPILLRGDEQTGAMLHGQASFTEPALPPAPSGSMDAGAGSIGGGPPGGALGGAALGGAAVGTAAMGAAHFAHQPGRAPEYRSGTGRYEPRPITAVRTPERRSYFQQHPKVRAALIGAGVGTAAGAVTGLVTHRGVVRGAAIGAGAGAGIGLIRSSDTLRRHPIVKNVATGAVAGIGLGMAGSHHMGNAGKLGAVGAAVGLGFGVLRDKLK